MQELVPLTPVQRALYDEAVVSLRREAGDPAGAYSYFLTRTSAGPHAVRLPARQWAPRACPATWSMTIGAGYESMRQSNALRIWVALNPTP